MNKIKNVLMGLSLIVMLYLILVMAFIIDGATFHG